MEVTNQAATIQAQPPSAMPTASVPNSVAQSAMSPQSISQVSGPTYQQAAPAPTYQQAPAQQGSAAQGNPWQAAFQALSQSLSTPSQSPAPVQYSAYQTPTPQANTPVAWASQAPQQQAQYSAAPTYRPQASTQAFSRDQVKNLVTQAHQQGASQAQDGYLSQVSNESLEVLQHFGAEAPNLLNKYACAVEDALVQQVKQGQQMGTMLKAAGEESQAMNLILTHPDVLADYVNGYYGPNGPYPTPTASEQAQIKKQNARQQFAKEIRHQEKNRSVPPNFQRPQMAMPTPGRSQGAQAKTNSFWNDFSQLMDQSPEHAWQYLSSAPQGALQSKLLVNDM